MAGFLFRKQKQGQNVKTSVVISSPSTLQPALPTPVYARFAASSTRESNDGTTSPLRRVSAPKPLGSPNQGRSQRGEKVGNGLEGKYSYSGSSLTSVDRDGQRRKVQDFTQQPQLTYESPSQSLLDKPLPPPVPSDADKPFILATRAIAAPPPDVVSTQEQLQHRISLVSQKPPGPSGIPRSTSSKTTFSRTRSTSTTSPSPSPSVMQVTDTQPRIQRQWSTSTSNQKMSENLSLTESTSFIIEDSPAGTSQNNLISEALEPTFASTSTASISSTQRTEGQGTLSERVMDYPKAFSSQHSDDIDEVPSQSSSFNFRRLDHGGSFASGKSLDQQSLASASSIRQGGSEMGLLRSPVSQVKPPTPRRVLPSPPSSPMGSNASSLSRVSAYHELYPSQVIMDLDRRSSVLDSSNQLLHRYQSTAQPVSPTPGSLHAQNGISERQPLRGSQGKTQQYLYSEHQHILTSPDSNPVSSTTYPLQSNLYSPPRGKPRIFAAMDAQENSQIQPLSDTSLPFSQQQYLQAASQSRESLTEEFSTPKLQFESLPEIDAEGDLSSITNTHDVAPALEPPPVQRVHSRKPSSSRSIARQDDPPKQIPPHTPRTKKLSKPRQPPDSVIHSHTPNGSTSTLPGASDGGQHKKIHKSQSKSRLTATAEPDPTVQLDEETIRNAGIPLDDDPFARIEGVKMLKPTSTLSTRHKASKETLLSSLTEDYDLRDEGGRSQEVLPPARSTTDAHRQTRKDKQPKSYPFSLERKPPEPATMSRLLFDPQILACLLQFFSFYEWCLLLSLSKDLRSTFVRNSALRETALERFLNTVGYSRWIWDVEPLSLSLQDLGDYMRGVSTPTHEYSRASAMYIHSLKVSSAHRDPSIRQTVQRFVASTRAYNRVLLRLRAQAEKEASTQSSASGTRVVSARHSPSARGGNLSRPSSRAPSPATSFHPSVNNFPGSLSHTNSSQTNLNFRSPLFKLRRAPLLRVFVPSPEGNWLSDKSVLECEAECSRAGVQHLLRAGDVVWDVAVGDEGNVGRLVWDGTYLIDLDYTYSAIGELPKYLPALAFPPSYFHRVIRTGHTSSNPIVHVDISPWGKEIATNLQLVQDRVRTETPQGAYHNVMRWVHRSSFQLRPIRGQQPGAVNLIPIPNSDNLFVDSGWYGTIVVETEGTNEALADLQDRCGLGAFPPRPQVHAKPTPAQIENRIVFRILRERSRPGEIWISAISMKERLL